MHFLNSDLVLIYEDKTKEYLFAGFADGTIRVYRTTKPGDN